MAAVKRFTVESVFKAIDQMTAPVRKMSKGLDKFHAKTKKGFSIANKAAGKFTGGLMKIGRTALIVGAILGVMFASVIRTGVEFEKQITAAGAKFKIVTKRGAADFDKITQAARLMGATTEFTASQAAEALKELGQAGFLVDQAISALPIILDFATASQLDMAEATTLAVRAMSTFGLKAADAATRAKNLRTTVDLLTNSSNSASLNITEMFEALKDSGKIAKTMGVNFEDLSTLIAVLANNAKIGTKAGTAVKRMMLAIGAPSRQGAAAMKTLGLQTIETINGISKFRNVFDIFADLEKIIGKRPVTDRPAILDAIFGKIPIDAVQGILSATGHEIETMRRRISQFGGTASEVANKVRDTVGNRLLILKSAFEELKLKIFDVAGGPFDKLIISMTKWLQVNDKIIAQNINDFIQKIIDNAPFIKFMVVSILALTLAFLALVVVLKVFLVIMTAVEIVMFLVATPAALITVAIVLLVGIIIAAIIIVVFFRKQLLEWWASLGLVGKILVWLVGGPIFQFMLAASFLIENWGAFSAFFGEIWRNIKNLFFNMMDAFDRLGTFGKIIALLIGGPLFLFAVTARFIIKNWDKVKEFFVTMGEVIGTAFDFIIDKAGILIDKIKPILAFIAKVTGLKALFELGGDIGDVLFADNPQSGPSTPQVINSTAERIERSTSESTSKTEVTLKLPAGISVENISGALGGLNLDESGAF